jgi:hypothetical protein
MTGLRGTPVNRRISPPSKIDSSMGVALLAWLVLCTCAAARLAGSDAFSSSSSLASSS